MNKRQVLIGVFGVSLLLGSGALAESVGVQPAASEHPKGHMPTEAQTDMKNQTEMKKETSDSASQQQLKQNVEKTDGGGAAIAAEQLGSTSVPADDQKPGMKKQGY